MKKKWNSSVLEALHRSTFIKLSKPCSYVCCTSPSRCARCLKVLKVYEAVVVTGTRRDSGHIGYYSSSPDTWIQNDFRSYLKEEDSTLTVKVFESTSAVAVAAASASSFSLEFCYSKSRWFNQTKNAAEQEDVMGQYADSSNTIPYCAPSCRVVCKI